MKIITKEKAIEERKKLIEVIAAEREKQEATAYMISPKTGIGITGIREFESGEKNVTFDTVIKFCAVLGLEIKIKKTEEKNQIEEESKLD